MVGKAHNWNTDWPWRGDSRNTLYQHPAHRQSHGILGGRICSCSNYPELPVLNKYGLLSAAVPMANPVSLQKRKDGMEERLPHMRWESLPISYSHITVVQKSELIVLLLVQTWFEDGSISDKKIIGETE